MDLVNAKDAYTFSPRPPFGCSDHGLIHLPLVYMAVVNEQPPTKNYVQKWCEEASERLF